MNRAPGRKLHADEQGFAAALADLENFHHRLAAPGSRVGLIGDRFRRRGLARNRSIVSAPASDASGITFSTTIPYFA